MCFYKRRSCERFIPAGFNSGAYEISEGLIEVRPLKGQSGSGGGYRQREQSVRRFFGRRKKSSDLEIPRGGEQVRVVS